MTPAELAAALSDAIGRPVGVRSPELATLEPELLGQGLPVSFARDVVALARGVADGDRAAVTPGVRRLTGRAPRSVEQFVAEHARALRELVPA